MNISDYLKAQEITQTKFADDVGVSVSMVGQWISNHRPVTPEKCVVIEKLTKGQVTRKDLRPSDWKLIWPELATSNKKVA